MLMRSAGALARKMGKSGDFATGKYSRMTNRFADAAMFDFAFRAFDGEDGLLEDAAKASVYGAAYMVAPWAVAAYEVGQMAQGAAALHKSGSKQIKQNRSVYEANFGGGPHGQVPDNQAAYTERQRAVAIARQSRQNASSYGLGFEARAMNRMQRRSR